MTAGDRNRAAAVVPGSRFDHPGCRVLLVFGGLAVGLLITELAARVWVAWRWPAEKSYALTHHTGTRGRFTYDSLLGYRGAPGFRDAEGRFTHNQYGFRGAPFDLIKRPGTLRLAILGASTAYGAFVADSETGAVRLETRLRDHLTPRPVKVLNGGVEGWTSLETLLNLQQRVLPLKPDLIVIIDGRNEIFPQVFNDFREDYSHYRIPGYDFRRSNYWHKVAFRYSHLFMLLADTRSGGSLGFDSRLENPSYASIRLENRPSVVELLRNVEDPGRVETYRRHLARAIGAAHEHGAELVLATMPFDQDHFRSGVIRRAGPETRAALAHLVMWNNDVMRKLARDSSVILVEAAGLAKVPGMLVDDCHFTPAGERAFAGMVEESIAAWLGPLTGAAGRGEGPGRHASAGLGTDRQGHVTERGAGGRGSPRDPVRRPGGTGRDA